MIAALTIFILIIIIFFISFLLWLSNESNNETKHRLEVMIDAYDHLQHNHHQLALQTAAHQAPQALQQQALPPLAPQQALFQTPVPAPTIWDEGDNDWLADVYAAHAQPPADPEVDEDLGALMEELGMRRRRFRGAEPDLGGWGTGPNAGNWGNVNNGGWDN